MGTIMLNGIAYGGDNFFRLTQAEYDALTPYEQTHGNYCITDAGATGDLAGNYVTYTSGDVADVDATSWSTVQPMASREGFAGLFNKISTMAKNVRYLYNKLKSTPQYDLLAYCLGGAGEQNITLGNNHAFSEYPYVYLALVYNDNHYSPTTMPLSLFSGHQTLISCNDGSNHIGYVLPMTDTSVKMCSLDSGYTIAIYGVKYI